MSACDGSLLYIDNMTLDTLSVTAVNPGGGTSLNDIAVGESIHPSEALQGQVYSTGGSDGKAWGSISLSAGDRTFTLSYSFTPANSTGKHPCTPSGSCSPSSSGDIQVTVATMKGDGPGAVLNFNFKTTP